MVYPNLISTVISESDLREILDAIDFISKKLPGIEDISKEEMAALPKMERNTIDFVLENLKEAESHPELIPKDIDVAEIEKDAELINTIYKVIDPLKKIVKKLEETALVAGSEAYLPSIAIYNAMKANAILKRHKDHKQKINA